MDGLSIWKVRMTIHKSLVRTLRPRENSEKDKKKGTTKSKLPLEGSYSKLDSYRIEDVQ